MQAIWSHPVAELVVFSNDFASRRAAQATVGNLDAPGVPDRVEDRLLVFPPSPADLEVVVPAQRAGSSRGHPTVHHHQLESAGNALPVQVIKHELGGPVLMG